MSTDEARLVILNIDRDSLPEEVRRQLSKSQPQRLGDQILEVVKKYGTVNIDWIITALWVEFKRIGNRRTVQQRVFELCDLGEIERVRQGHYKSKGVQQ